MPDPKQYLLNLPNPTANVISGLSAIPTIKAMQAQRRMAEIENQTAMAMAKLTPQSPVEDWVAIANLLPKDKAESLRKNFEMLTGEKQKEVLKFGGQVYAALPNDPDVAIDMLNNAATAATNSGDMRQAKAYDTWAKLVEADPEGAQRTIGVLLAALPGGADVISALKEHGEELRAEEKHPLELVKMELENDKARAKLEAAERLGGYDPEVVFKQEQTLRTMYDKWRSNYQESLGHYEKIKSSARDKSPSGDAAMIFAFMKMLDPRSVVRESEFAIAQNTTALVNKLEYWYQRAESGERLLPQQRADFERLAAKYMESTQKLLQKETTRLDKTIEDFGLDRERVLGPEATRNYEVKIPPREATSENLRKGYLKFEQGPANE